MKFCTEAVFRFSVVLRVDISEFVPLQSFFSLEAEGASKVDTEQENLACMSWFCFFIFCLPYVTKGA